MRIPEKERRPFFVQGLLVSIIAIITGLPLTAQVGSDTEQPFDQTRARLAYFFQELKPIAIKQMSWLRGEPRNPDILPLDSGLVMKHFES